jgi:integrase
VGAAGDRADRLEDIMSEQRLVDSTGRLRSPAATPGHWAGYAPSNKWLRYPADPPTVEEIILVMREAGPGAYADRIRGLIAILWRAGLRISESLALTESDLDPNTGSVLVRSGKGGKRRMVGMDDWGWEHVGRWTEHRNQLPIGPLFCILAGPTRGRGWSATAARGELRGSRLGLVCVGGSRHISCGMLTRSKWRTKGSRCRSSSASWGIMRTSGSRRSTCKVSIHARSSIRCTTAGRPLIPASAGLRR